MLFRRKVVDSYPLIQFGTVVVFPFLFWILTLEAGSMFTQEYFMPTYGQVSPSPFSYPLPQTQKAKQLT